MDKRWIFIFIIIIIGALCAYFIIDNSTTVGSAITDVNKSIVTMPDGFSKGDSDKDSVLIVNKQSNEKAYLKDLCKMDESKERFNNKMSSFSADGVEITENNTLNINNITVYTFYYLNETGCNNSVSYFCSFNHTFYLKMTGYTDTDKMNSDLEFIASTLQPDYKKSQD